MRVFVAVWPNAAVVERLAEIERPARPGVRWTTADQWHVTLCFIGEVDEEEVHRVKGGLERLGLEVPMRPVVAVAGPALERLGPSVLCVPVAGLEEVASAVVAVVAGSGPVRERQPYQGHLTIARAARGVDPRPPVPVPFSASWTVNEVTLVASTLHPVGARYQVIGRFHLDADRYP